MSYLLLELLALSTLFALYLFICTSQAIGSLAIRLISSTGIFLSFLSLKNPVSVFEKSWREQGESLSMQFCYSKYVALFLATVSLEGQLLQFFRFGNFFICLLSILGVQCFVRRQLLLLKSTQFCPILYSLQVPPCPLMMQESLPDPSGG